MDTTTTTKQTIMNNLLIDHDPDQILTDPFDIDGCFVIPDSHLRDPETGIPFNMPCDEIELQSDCNRITIVDKVIRPPPARCHANIRVISKSDHAFLKTEAIQCTKNDLKRMRKLFPYVCSGPFDIEVLAEAFYNFNDLLYHMNWYKSCKREQYGLERIYFVLFDCFRLPRFEESLKFMLIPRKNEAIYYFVYNYKFFFNLFTYGQVSKYTPRGCNNRSWTRYSESDVFMHEVDWVRKYCNVESWRSTGEAEKWNVAQKKAFHAFKMELSPGMHNVINHNPGTPKIEINTSAKIKGLTAMAREQSWRSTVLENDGYKYFAVSTMKKIRESELADPQKMFLRTVIMQKKFDNDLVLDLPWKVSAIAWLSEIPEVAHYIELYNVERAKFLVEQQQFIENFVAENKPIDLDAAHRKLKEDVTTETMKEINERFRFLQTFTNSSSSEEYEVEAQGFWDDLQSSFKKKSRDAVFSEMFAYIWDQIKEFFSNFFSNVAAGVSSVVSKIIDFLKDAYRKMVDYLEKTFDFEVNWEFTKIFITTAFMYAASYCARSFSWACEWICYIVQLVCESFGMLSSVFVAATGSVFERLFRQEGTVEVVTSEDFDDESTAELEVDGQVGISELWDSIRICLVGYRISEWSSLLNIAQKIPQILTSIGEMMKFFINKIYFFFNEENLFVTIEDQDDLQKYVDKISDFQTVLDIKTKACKDAKLGMAIVKHADEAPRFHKLLMSLPNSTPCKSEGLKLIDWVRQVANHVKGTLYVYQKRVETFCIWLHGKPGGGKTRCQPFIAHAIYDGLKVQFPDLFPDEWTDSQMFSKAKGQDFWDGYNDPFCYVNNDMLCENDSKARAKELSEFMSICDTNTFPLNYADCGSKGTKAFVSPLMMCSSNATDAQIENISGMTDLNATWKRRGMYLETKQKDKLLRDGSNWTDAWEFVCRRPLASEPKRVFWDLGAPKELKAMFDAAQTNTITLTVKQVCRIAIAELARRYRMREADVNKHSRDFFADICSTSSSSDSGDGSSSDPPFPPTGPMTPPDHDFLFEEENHDELESGPLCENVWDKTRFLTLRDQIRYIFTKEEGQSDYWRFVIPGQYTRQEQRDKERWEAARHTTTVEGQILIEHHGKCNFGELESFEDDNWLDDITWTFKNIGWLWSWLGADVTMADQWKPVVDELNNSVKGSRREERCLKLIHPHLKDWSVSRWFGNPANLFVHNLMVDMHDPKYDIRREAYEFVGIWMVFKTKIYANPQEERRLKMKLVNHKYARKSRAKMEWFNKRLNLKQAVCDVVPPYMGTEVYHVLACMGCFKNHRASCFKTAENGNRYPHHLAYPVACLATELMDADDDRARREALNKWLFFRAPVSGERMDVRSMFQDCSSAQKFLLCTGFACLVSAVAVGFGSMVSYFVKSRRESIDNNGVEDIAQSEVKNQPVLKKRVKVSNEGQSAGKNVPVLQKRKKTTAEGQSLDSRAVNIALASISMNTRQFVCHYADDSCSGNCLIFGRRMITFRHYFAACGTDFNTLSIVNGGVESNIFLRSQLKLVPTSDRDMFIVELPPQFQEMPMNKSKLLPKERYREVAFSHTTQFYRLHREDAHGKVWIRSEPASNIAPGTGQLGCKWTGRMGSGKVGASDWYIMHDGFGEKGYCGLPWYCVDKHTNQVYLMGFHIAQSGRHSIMTPIYQEDLPKDLAFKVEGQNGIREVYRQGPYFPECVSDLEITGNEMHINGRLVVMGTSKSRKHMPHDTCFVATPFQAARDKPAIYPITMMPALLTATNVEQDDGSYKLVQPLYNAINKVVSAPVRPCPSDYKQLSEREDEWQTLGAGFFPLVKPSDITPITIEDVIFGKPDVYDGLDTATSVGAVMRYHGFVKRSQLWNKETRWIHPKLRQCVQTMITYLKFGYSIRHVVEACLKDELRDMERVMAGKTRLFCVGDLVHLIVMVMYLGRITTFLKAYRNELDVSIGINPHGIEWKFLYEKIMSLGGNLGGGDFSNFDTSIMSYVSWCLGRCLLHWLDIDQYSEIGFIMLELIHSCTGPIMILGNTVVQLDYMNSSGQWWTGVLNSWANVSMSNLFHFRLHGTQPRITSVREFYGDDNIWSTLDNQFTMNTFAKFVFDNFGMTYTASDKKQVSKDYIQEDELEYLARKFRVDGSNVFAPLHEEAIHGMMLWIRSPKKIDGEFLRSETEQLALNTDVVAMEWFHYGKERFQYETKRVREYCQFYNVPYLGRSFSYYMKAYMDGVLGQQPPIYDGAVLIHY